MFLHSAISARSCLSKILSNLVFLLTEFTLTRVNRSWPGVAAISLTWLTQDILRHYTASEIQLDQHRSERDFTCLDTLHRQSQSCHISCNMAWIFLSRIASGVGGKNYEDIYMSVFLTVPAQHQRVWEFRQYIRLLCPWQCSIRLVLRSLSILSCTRELLFIWGGIAERSSITKWLETGFL